MSSGTGSNRHSSPVIGPSLEPAAAAPNELFNQLSQVKAELQQVSRNHRIAQEDKESLKRGYEHVLEEKKTIEKEVGNSGHCQENWKAQFTSFHYFFVKRF